MREYVLRWHEKGVSHKEVIPDTDMTQDAILDLAKSDSEVRGVTVVVFRKTDGEMDDWIRAYQKGVEIANKPLDTLADMIQ